MAAKSKSKTKSEITKRAKAPAKRTAKKEPAKKAAPARKKALKKKAPAKKAAPAAKKAVKVKTAARSENKTKPTTVDVAAFIDRVPDATRRSDAKALVAMMERVTGEPPRMWGPAIVGFGEYQYKYESGREGVMCRTGFSPRADSLVLYVLSGLSEEAGLLRKLGKHSTGKSCLYVKKLEDVDMATLEEVVAKGYAHMREKYPT